MNLCRELGKENEETYLETHNILHKGIYSLKDHYSENLIKRFHDEYSLENIKNKIQKNNQTRYFGSFEDEDLKGILIDQSFQDIPFWINSILWVVSKESGKGIGSSLMRKSIDLSKKRGESKIYLEVSEDNFPALNLYQKFGFKEQKTYSLSSGNTLILEKSLKSN